MNTSFDFSKGKKSFVDATTFRLKSCIEKFHRHNQ